RELAQHALMEQQKDAAFRNFELAMTSAKTLLEALSKSVSRGEMTTVAAADLLGAEQKIIDRVKSLDSTPRTVSLEIEVTHSISDIQADLGNYNEAYSRAESAKALAETVLRGNPRDSQFMQLLYASLWRMGDAIAQRQGDRAALPNYRAAAELM